MSIRDESENYRGFRIERFDVGDEDREAAAVMVYAPGASKGQFLPGLTCNQDIEFAKAWIDAGCPDDFPPTKHDVDWRIHGSIQEHIRHYFPSDAAPINEDWEREAREMIHTVANMGHDAGYCSRCGSFHNHGARCQLAS